MKKHMISGLVLSAIALAASAPAFAQDTLRVGKSVSFSWTFTPVEIGMEVGIFAKENLKIVVTSFAGDARLQQGMTADSVDIGIGGGPGLGFFAKGVPAKGIAAMASAPMNMAMAVAADSPIKSIKDLKGKKIGVTTVGSLTDWLAIQASVQNGWGLNGVTTVSVGGMETSRAALKTKQVDALVTAAASGYVLEATKEWRVLQTLGEFAPDFHTHIIFATDKIVQGNPDAVKRFLKGWFATIDWMKANKQRTVEISSKVLNLDPAAIARTYDNEIGMFSTNGVFDPKAMAVLKKSFIDMKILDAEPKDSDMIDTRFVPVVR